MVKSNYVTIKGIRDGLVFLLSDQCEFDHLVSELRYKLEHSHQSILTGPIVHVDVKLGNRKMIDQHKETILDIFKSRGNLFIRSIQSVPANPTEAQDSAICTRCGMIRSGQVLYHEGNLLFLGDINPGGMISCTGDVYVMGALRGIVHAGTNGNMNTIIAASLFAPAQLKIAHVISRPPDEWESREAGMEFAYLQDENMQIDKMSNIVRIRENLNVFKGE